MEPKPRLMLPLVPFLIFALIQGCSEDPTDPNGDDGGCTTELTAADSVAWRAMQALGDSLEKLPDVYDWDDVDWDYYEGLRYHEIRDDMDRALQMSSESRVAHLGSAILDVIEINYDPDVWEMLDSLVAYIDDDDDPVPPGVDGVVPAGLHIRPGSPILGNQFSLLASAPGELARRTLFGVPGNLTVARAQELIDDVLMPSVDSALEHLDQVLTEDCLEIRIELEDEVNEIDMGEVYLFDAALRAARAGLKIATSYNLELLGPDGTYNWIDDIRNADECDEFGYLEPYDDQYRIITVYRDRTQASQDSMMISILQYNLEQSPEFLSRRDNRMASAYADLQAARDQLAAGVAAIREEQDGQTDDIVKIADLVELDEEIQEERDRFRFSENFTTIEDVLEWIDEVLTGTYHVSEEGDFGEIEFDVRLSALFNSPPASWREYLPYYRFKPASQWLVWEYDSYVYDTNPDFEECYTTCSGETYCQTGVVQREWRDYDYDFEPLDFLDGPGGDPVDLDEVTLPYVPDYTFGNLFPGATRDTWL
ncbi:MAG: hypothetical protein GF355_08920, partial [Candidatus Eisenbacteria bacterium]|nr:hypothetical protein [Candidatus Eisenbacteria bacterium]